MKIEIVGVDISLRNIGICVAHIETTDTHPTVTVRSVSLIQPPKADASTKKAVRKNSDDLRRARWLQQNLTKAIEGCSMVAVEMPVGSQSARAMASYGICVGVLSSIKIPFIEVTPTEVKVAGNGSKTATKHEMIEWAVQKHPEIKWKTRKSKGVEKMTDDNEHIADALACIYAAIDTEQFKSAVAFSRTLTRGLNSK